MRHRTLSVDLIPMASHTAAQIVAVTEALELTASAIQRIAHASLPMSLDAVQGAESHLFRAHAYLTALLKNATSAGCTPEENGRTMGVHEDESSSV